MARESVVKEIDGHTYEIGQLSPSVLINLIPIFGSIVGGAVGNFMNGTQSDSKLRIKCLIECGLTEEELEEYIVLKEAAIKSKGEVPEDARVDEFQKKMLDNSFSLDWKDLFNEFFLKLKDKNVTELMQKILSNTYPIGDDIKKKTSLGNAVYFDTYLMSRDLGVGHMIKVFIAAMEVQYDDFFGEKGVLNSFTGL